MRSTVARGLADVLQRQHGVIATRQIMAAGWDHELAARELAAGRWQRPSRGIYFAFAGAPSLLQRAWCAQLIGGPTSRVSGPLACHLRGIADAPGQAAVILVPTACRRTGAAEYRIRRTSRMPAAVEGETGRLVGAARAVVDATRLAGSLREARAVVCAAINAQHVSYDDLLGEGHAEGFRGLGLFRRSLEDWADGARSAPEAEVADALRRQVLAGNMPPFLLNPRLYVGPVLLGVVDVYVPGCALGGEVDSVRHHGGEGDLDATLTRHAVITREGVQLEHITPTRFRRSPATWASMFAAVARARSCLGDPMGLRIEPGGPLQTGRRCT